MQGLVHGDPSVGCGCLTFKIKLGQNPYVLWGTIANKDVLSSEKSALLLFCFKHTPKTKILWWDIERLKNQ